MIDRRTLILGGIGWALPVTGVSAERSRRCGGEIIVVDDQDRVVATAPLGAPDLDTEFQVTPRTMRWKRDTISWTHVLDASWDAPLRDGFAILDEDMTRCALRRGDVGVIRVDFNPNLPTSGYLGWCQVWVRDNEPDAIIRAVVMMGIPPGDQDFREVLLHELGHAVGLQHETKRDEQGRPIAIMHPSAMTGYQDYTADDLRGLAALRYRGDGIRNQRRRRHRRRRRR